MLIGPDKLMIKYITRFVSLYAQSINGILLIFRDNVSLLLWVLWVCKNLLIVYLYIVIFYATIVSIILILSTKNVSRKCNVRIQQSNPYDDAFIRCAHIVNIYGDDRIMESFVYQHFINIALRL